MAEDGEGVKPQGTVGKRTRSLEMPPFASNKYDNPNRLNKIARGAGAAALGLGAAGLATGTIDNGAEAVVDATKTTHNIVESVTDGIRVPIDVGIDLAGRLIPDDELGVERTPNRILLGKVEVNVTDDLNIRRSPNTTGKADSPNEASWRNLKLANKVVVDGKVTYEPIEVDKGDSLIIENPELVSGEYTGGGSGVRKDKDWIQLFTEDGTTVYINFQAETSEFVREIKEDPTVPSKYVNAETLQDSGGIKIVKFDTPPPQKTSHITVQQQ